MVQISAAAQKRRQKRRKENIPFELRRSASWHTNSHMGPGPLEEEQASPKYQKRHP